MASNGKPDLLSYLFGLGGDIFKGAGSAIGGLLGNSSLLSTVGGLIGSLFTNSSNQSIANQNIQMQRETNALQQKMFYDAQAYNTAERQAAQEYNTSERIASQDWNAQQALLERLWNSPEQQVQRMLEAGLNPFVSGLGNVATSAASASNPASINGASSPGLPSLVAPRNDYHNTIMADTLQAVATMSQVANIRADTQERKESLRFKLENLFQDLENKKADVKSKFQAWKIGEIQKSILGLTKQGMQDDYFEDRQSKVLQNSLTRQNIQVAYAQEAELWAKECAERLTPMLQAESNQIQAKAAEQQYQGVLKSIALGYSNLQFQARVQDWSEKRFQQEFAHQKYQDGRNLELSLRKLRIDKKTQDALVAKYYEETKSLMNSNQGIDFKLFQIPAYDKFRNYPTRQLLRDYGHNFNNVLNSIRDYRFSPYQGEKRQFSGHTSSW